jgi:hypothetical protein
MARSRGGRLAEARNYNSDRSAVRCKDAIDAVCSPLGHEDVAKSLGVSAQTVRQARLSPTAKAVRAPPSGWESAIIRLAERRMMHYRTLIERLRSAEL